MKDYKKILGAITVFIAIVTLGGLGNAAVTVDKIYWLPFVLDIPFFGFVCYKLFKAENEKADNITDKPRDRKTGRHIKSDGGKAK